MDEHSLSPCAPLKDSANCTAGQKEKDDLRGLIIRYIDALLEIAIKNGEAINKNIESADSIEELSKTLFSGMNKPDIVMDGISLLYDTDVKRANARMRQYFECVQKIPDIKEQLIRCYAMVRCLNGRLFPVPSGWDTHKNQN